MKLSKQDKEALKEHKRKEAQADELFNTLIEPLNLGLKNRLYVRLKNHLAVYGFNSVEEIHRDIQRVILLTVYSGYSPIDQSEITSEYFNQREKDAIIKYQNDPSFHAKINYATGAIISTLTGKRCLITNNLCGTDTYQKDHMCNCDNCVDYFKDYLRIKETMKIADECGL